MMLRAALGFAKRGKPVFPCKPDKTPLTPNGFKDATTDPNQITEWWTKHPEALIGMPTGAVSGVVVLDVEPAQAGLHRLEMLDHLGRCVALAEEVGGIEDQDHRRVVHLAVDLGQEVAILADQIRLDL